MYQKKKTNQGARAWPPFPLPVSTIPGATLFLYCRALTQRPAQDLPSLALFPAGKSIPLFPAALLQTEPRLVQHQGKRAKKSGEKFSPLPFLRKKFKSVKRIHRFFQPLRQNHFKRVHRARKRIVQRGLVRLRKIGKHKIG